MALIKDYFEKTKHYNEEYGENSIVLMQVGAFFEVYGMQNQTTKNITGSKIVEFSSICDLNIAEKKNMRRKRRHHYGRVLNIYD